MGGIRQYARRWITDRREDGSPTQPRDTVDRIGTDRGGRSRPALGPHTTHRVPDFRRAHREHQTTGDRHQSAGPDSWDPRGRQLPRGARRLRLRPVHVELVRDGRYRRRREARRFGSRCDGDRLLPGAVQGPRLCVRPLYAVVTGASSVRPVVPARKRPRLGQQPARDHRPVPRERDDGVHPPPALPLDSRRRSSRRPSSTASGRSGSCGRC